MVKKTFSVIAVSCALFLAGCSVDILGVLGSSDLDQRLKAKDSFIFLSAEDRQPVFGEEYSFIVVTDTHIKDAKTFGFEKIKNALDSEVKFVAVVGDITQNGERQDIEKFIEIAESLGVPCYPVIGNHDIYFGNWPEWKDAIGSACYRVDGDSATLFMLDSANAFFGNKQLDWFEKELKTAKGRVFVFSHVNLFEQNPLKLQQFTDDRERARIISILKNRCDSMFMGHSHKRMEREIGGVQFVSIEDFRSNSVYCRVTVTKNGISRRFERL